MTDVVVPAHNEATRIAPVIEAILGSPLTSSCIVVADDCNDQTADVARLAGAFVTEIGARNKGTAMAAGLRLVNTRRVMFSDADIVGLRPEHVSLMLSLPPLDGQLVGVRGNTVAGTPLPFARVFGALPSLSGERRLPTDFVRSVRLAGTGWEPETALNVAVVRAGLPHRQVILKGVANRSKAIRSPAAWLDELAQVVKITALYGPDLARYFVTTEG